MNIYSSTIRNVEFPANKELEITDDVGGKKERLLLLLKDVWSKTGVFLNKRYKSKSLPPA